MSVFLETPALEITVMASFSHKSPSQSKLDSALRPRSTHLPRQLRVWETKSVLLLERRAQSGTALGGNTFPKEAREPKVQHETWERCRVAQVVRGDLVPIGHVRMLSFFMRDFAGR